MSKHILDGDSATRKSAPMARGLLHYFPDALAEVSRISMFGNEKHNPGQPLHWSFDKSADHADCVVRHIARAGLVDSDGIRESALAAWRALANLQAELMRDLGLPDPIGVRRDPPEDAAPVNEPSAPGPDKPSNGFRIAPGASIQLSVGGKALDLPVSSFEYESARGEIHEVGEAPASFNVDIKLSEQDAANLNSFIDYMDKHAPLRQPVFPEPGVYADPDHQGKLMVVTDDGFAYRGCEILSWGAESPSKQIEMEVSFFARRELPRHPMNAEALREQDEAQLIRN